MNKTVILIIEEKYFSLTIKGYALSIHPNYVYLPEQFRDKYCYYAALRLYFGKFCIAVKDKVFFPRYTYEE